MISSKARYHHRKSGSNVNIKMLIKQLEIGDFCFYRIQNHHKYHKYYTCGAKFGIGVGSLTTKRLRTVNLQKFTLE